MVLVFGKRENGDEEEEGEEEDEEGEEEEINVEFLDDVVGGNI